MQANHSYFVYSTTDIHSLLTDLVGIYVKKVRKAKIVKVTGSVNKY